MLSALENATQDQDCHMLPAFDAGVKATETPTTEFDWGRVTVCCQCP